MRTSDRVAQYLVENLALTHFFGVSGANIEDLFIALDGKSNIILAKHEFNAATMCDGYFRTSQKMAVLLTTSGGGALNIVPALAESFTSRVPLIAIVGSAPQALEGRGAFQDTSGKCETLNLEKIYEEVSCFCKKVTDKNQILDYLERAYGCALKYKQPSIIIVPKNIWNEPLLADSPQPLNDLIENEDSTFDFTLTGNTLCILGEELLRVKKTQEIVALVRQLDCYTMVTPEAKSFALNGFDKFLGVAGVMGELSEEVTTILNSLETILLLGTRFGVMEKFGIEAYLNQRNKKIVSISQFDSFYFGENITRVRIRNEEHFVHKVESLLLQFANKSKSLKALTPKKIEVNHSAIVSINKLGELLNTTFSTKPINWVFDAGNVVCNAVKSLVVNERSTFTIALGMGGMGFSFGAAIGATCSNQNYSVVLAGDGSFYMSGMEIHTAIQYKLPVLFIIVNNNAHAMCVTREELFFGKKSSLNHFFKANLALGLSEMFPEFQSFEIHCYQDWFDHQSQFINIMYERKPFGIVINVDVNEIPEFLPFKRI